MNKYIGGEFGRFPLKNTPQIDNPNEKTIFCMSGRTALYAIMQDIISKRNIKSVYAPSYCSRSMIEPILDSNINPVFYEVQLGVHGLEIDYNAAHNCDCILLLDYFGFCNEQLIQIADIERKKGTIVIFDQTQAFLCNQPYSLHADYTFVSFRKWFASSAACAFSMTGFTNPVFVGVNSRYESLRNTGFNTIQNTGSCSNILDDSEVILRSDYKNYCPSSDEISYLETIDFETIRKKRIRNASVLMEAVRGIPQISLIYDTIKEKDCPLYIPIIIEEKINRDFIVSELLKNNIECYVHWGFSQFHNQSYKNHILFKKEISLFCDQRYAESDMYRIADSLKKAIISYEVQHETNRK